MQFRNVLALRGPNIWAWSPVLEALVDLGQWKDTPSSAIPGFTDRLLHWLPSLIEHRCSVGERGGFVQRLKDGTYFAHILEHVAIELQSLCGVELGFGRARETSEEGVYKVVFKYREEMLARACLETARELVLAAANNQPFDIAAHLERLRELARRNLPSAGVDAILDAARARNIPVLQLDRAGLLLLGQGRNQRRIRAAQTDRTGALAASVAEDQDLSRRLLEAAALPTLTGTLVHSADEAWDAAESIGLPVVVRPQIAFEGRGVTRDVATREQAAAAFDAAREFSSSVIVERHVPGLTYRVLVVGGKMVSAVRCGRRRAEVTAEVHPKVARIAIEATRAVGLEIADVEVIAHDISVPLEDQDGVIAEVNPTPPLDLYVSTPEGQRRVGEALVATLFPPGETGRIPLIAITGTNGKTTVTRFIAHILRATGKHVGMSCTDGIYLDDRRITRGDCSGPTSARHLLMHPQVEIAVCETARGGMLRAGLAFNECQVAVVTNIAAGDHLGIGGIKTPADLAKVKGMIVDVVSPEGVAVLNAADPHVAEMAGRCRGSVMFFGLTRDDSVIRNHLAAGGQAIFVDGGDIVHAQGGKEQRVVAVNEIPLTMSGRIRFQIENALAAVGAALAAGLDSASIAGRARSFGASLDAVPTRFNIFEHNGATVVIDFGHNPDALRAVIDALAAFPNPQRVALYSASGDRRDSDIVELGVLLGNAFDRVILYEDTDLYGRQPGAITALMRHGLAQGSRVREIQELEGGLNALRYAWSTVRPGELLLAQAHTADPTVEFLKQTEQK